MKYEIEGMRELRKSMKKLEKIPQKCVTKASRKGANIALKQAKTKAPEDTSMLKKSLRLVGERARKKEKKAYQVVPDRSYNDIFQYKRKRGNQKGKVTGYYPASQEFGWQTTNGKYTPGYSYLRDSLTEKKQEIETAMVKVLTNEIDKL